jgi:hypothetical protein
MNWGRAPPKVKAVAKASSYARLIRKLRLCQQASAQACMSEVQISHIASVDLGMLRPVNAISAGTDLLQTIAAAMLVPSKCWASMQEQLSPYTYPPKMRPCVFLCCGWQMNVFCRLVEGKGTPGSVLPVEPVAVLLLLLLPPTKAGSSVRRRYSARRGCMKARAAGVAARHASESSIAGHVMQHLKQSAHHCR